MILYIIKQFNIVPHWMRKKKLNWHILYGYSISSSWFKGREWLEYLIKSIFAIYLAIANLTFNVHIGGAHCKK